MAANGGIRSKIHAFWEAFFPSSIYFLVFILVAVLIYGPTHFLDGIRVLYVENTPERRSSLIAILKDLELLKLAPLAAIFILAFLVYAFDRIVSFIGNVVPPFPVWSGSPGLYVDQNRLKELWLLMPHVTNVAALHFEAKAVIDEAETNGKHLPDRGEDYLSDRFNKAARMLAYAKAGIVWSIITFLAVIVASRAELASLAWLIVAVALFALLGIIALILQTRLLILQAEASLSTAATLLYASGVRSSDDQNRFKAFERARENSIKYAPRFFGLTWSQRHDWRSLRDAFFGFKESVRRKPEQGQRTHPSQ